MRSLAIFSSTVCNKCALCNNNLPVNDRTIFNPFARAERMSVWREIQQPPNGDCGQVMRLCQNPFARWLNAALTETSYTVHIVKRILSASTDWYGYSVWLTARRTATLCLIIIYALRFVFIDFRVFFGKQSDCFFRYRNVWIWLIEEGSNVPEKQICLIN